MELTDASQNKLSTPAGRQKLDLTPYMSSYSDTSISNGVPLTPANTPAYIPDGQGNDNVAGLLQTAQKQRELAQCTALKLMQVASSMPSNNKENAGGLESGTPATTSFFSSVPAFRRHPSTAAQSPAESLQTKSDIVDHLNMALRALGHTPSKFELDQNTPVFTIAQHNNNNVPAHPNTTPISKLITFHNTHPPTPASSLSGSISNTSGDKGNGLSSATSMPPSSTHTSGNGNGGYNTATKKLTDLQHRHSRLLSEVDTASRALKTAETKRDRAVAELKAVTRQVDAADEKLASLQRRVTQLTSETEAKQQAADALDASLAALRAEIQEAETLRESSKKESKRAAQELHQVSGRLAGTRMELQRMEARFAQREKELKEQVKVELATAQQQVEQRVKSASAELATLLEKQQEAQSAADAANAARREAATALDLLLKQRQREEEEAQQAQHEARALLNGLQAEHASVESLAAEAKTILNDRLIAAETAQKEVDASQGRLTLLLAAIETANTRIAELKAEEKTVTQALKDRQLEYTEVDSKCKHIEEELSFLSSQLVSVEKLRVEEAGKLKAATIELECVKTSQAAAEKELQTTLEKNAAATEKFLLKESEMVKEQRERIKRLEAELREAQQDASDAIVRAESAEESALSAQREEHQLEAELKSAQELAARKSDQITAMQASSAAECEARWALEADLLHAQDEAKTAREEVERMRAQHAQSIDRQVSAAEMKVAEMRGAAAAEAQRAEHAEERAQQAEQRAAVAEEQMCQALMERDAAADRAEELQLEIAALHTEVSSLTSSLAGQREAAAHTTSQVEDLHQGLIKLKAERNEARDMCSTLQQHVDALQQRLREEVSRAAHAEIELETGGHSSQQEIEALRESLGDVKSKNSTLKATAARLARALASFMRYASAQSKNGSSSGGGLVAWEKEYEGIKELLDELTAVEVLLRDD